MSLVGLLAMIVIAWLVSKHRRVVPWRTIAWGLGLQLTFALLVLKTDAGRVAFGALNDAVITVLDVTARGTEFVFGAYANETFTIAINVLPTIVFFSSLMTILYYLGVMQRVVRGFAWLMTRTMRTSGPETLSVAANSFVGMTEAPLMVAPFIGSMTSAPCCSRSLPWSRLPTRCSGCRSSSTTTGPGSKEATRYGRSRFSGS